MPILKRENSIHVRVNDEADSALELMSHAGGKAKAELAADLLEDALLGRAHALKVAAIRYARSGLGGNDRERGE